MLSLDEQLARGALACPLTREALVKDGTFLRTRSGSQAYPLIGEIPVLLDPSRQREVVSRAAAIAPAECPAAPPRRRLADVAGRILAASSDRRTLRSLEALARVIDWQPDSALCLSIGGGPTRNHRQLVNMNLHLFPNVDVVADAYALPYATGSVDAIHCEAVLEHLEEPDRAVAEMRRVLVPGGQVYAATPFLAPFHAYPDHFQNFTLEGHRRLFLRAAFEIVDAGVCVGPTFALAELLVEYVRGIAPTYRLCRSLADVLAVGLVPSRRLDDRLSRRANGHILASSTFVHAVNPAAASAVGAPAPPASGARHP